MVFVLLLLSTLLLMPTPARACTMYYNCDSLVSPDGDVVPPGFALRQASAWYPCDATLYEVDDEGTLVEVPLEELGDGVWMAPSDLAAGEYLLEEGLESRWIAVRDEDPGGPTHFPSFDRVYRHVEMVPEHYDSMCRDVNYHPHLIESVDVSTAGVRSPYSGWALQVEDRNRGHLGWTAVNEGTARSFEYDLGRYADLRDGESCLTVRMFSPTHEEVWSEAMPCEDLSTAACHCRQASGRPGPWSAILVLAGLAVIAARRMRPRTSIQRPVILGLLSASLAALWFVAAPAGAAEPPQPSVFTAVRGGVAITPVAHEVHGVTRLEFGFGHRSERGMVHFVVAFGPFYEQALTGHGWDDSYYSTFAEIGAEMAGMVPLKKGVFFVGGRPMMDWMSFDGIPMPLLSTHAVAGVLVTPDGAPPARITFSPGLSFNPLVSHPLVNMTVSVGIVLK